MEEEEEERGTPFSCLFLPLLLASSLFSVFLSFHSLSLFLICSLPCFYHHFFSLSFPPLLSLPTPSLPFPTLLYLPFPSLSPPPSPLFSHYPFIHSLTPFPLPLLSLIFLPLPPLIPSFLLSFFLPLPPLLCEGKRRGQLFSSYTMVTPVTHIHTNTQTKAAAPFCHVIGSVCFGLFLFLFCSMDVRGGGGRWG